MLDRWCIEQRCSVNCVTMLRQLWNDVPSSFGSAQVDATIPSFPRRPHPSFPRRPLPSFPRRPQPSFPRRRESTAAPIQAAGPKSCWILSSPLRPHPSSPLRPHPSFPLRPHPSFPRRPHPSFPRRRESTAAPIQAAGPKSCWIPSFPRRPHPSFPRRRESIITKHRAQPASQQVERHREHGNQAAETRCEQLGEAKTPASARKCYSRRIFTGNEA
jgi:hypothetical protein